MRIGFVLPQMSGIGACLYIYDWRHVLQRDLLGQHRLDTFPSEKKSTFDS